MSRARFLSRAEFDLSVLERKEGEREKGGEGARQKEEEEEKREKTKEEKYFYLAYNPSVIWRVTRLQTAVSPFLVAAEESSLGHFVPCGNARADAEEPLAVPEICKSLRGIR